MKRKPMKQHAIGEEFELNGKTFYPVEAHGKNCCHFCAFDFDFESCADAVCEGSRRADGIDVRYKEKV